MTNIIVIISRTERWKSSCCRRPKSFIFLPWTLPFRGGLIVIIIMVIIKFIIIMVIRIIIKTVIIMKVIIMATIMIIIITQLW